MYSRLITSFLRTKVPFVYGVLRFFYQVPFIMMSKGCKNIYVPCSRVPSLAGEHLFGYYDKSPWDITGKRFISLNVPFANHHPSTCNKASIELVELETGKAQIIAMTYAWNLQQGCRLQWLGPDFGENILFNDFRDGRFITVIQNVASGKERLINRPSYDVASDGRFALSVDFERLHHFRPGYGYKRGHGTAFVETDFEVDGIWRVDLETEQSRLIISFARILQDVGEMPTAISAPRFKHIMINPTGTHFMFLYRWKKGNVELTRLYTAKMDGTELSCLAQDGLVSHATWKNDMEILAWARQVGQGEHFFLFHCAKSGSDTIIGKGILTEDGHPSYSPCGRYILTDTYANRSRQRRLFIFDSFTEKVYSLGKFYAPFRYSGETRCDLHPRWEQNGLEVCFDSAHEGSRQIYVADISCLNLGL